MNPLNSIWRHLRSLGQNRAVKQEIDEELRFHLEQRTVDNVAQGMPPEDAARAARKRFGNVQSVREDCRDIRGANFGETMLQDIRFVFRQLRKNPGFTVVTVLTLALGIGANTAVFTVVNSLLLKPLPWPDSDRVMFVWESNLHKGYSRTPMAAAQFLDLRRGAKSFSALAVWSSDAVNLANEGAPPERCAGSTVTEDFPRVVGVVPIRGSGFTSDQFKEGGDGVVMIGYSVWQQRFGGDPNVIGREIRLNGRARTVVGVMPPGFQTPAKAQFWMPKVFTARELEDRDMKAQVVVGRLAGGVTVEQAQAELTGLFAGLRSRYPEFLDGWTVLVHPVLRELVQPVQPALLLLLAVVVAVLLMACLNVAGLQLARGAGRARELSVRLALGAGRGALVRLLLVESLMLAVFGGVLSLAMAHWILGALLFVAPANLPRIDQVRMDGAALAFTAGVCLLAGLIFGLMPAWRLSQAEPVEALRGGSSSGSLPASRLRRGLVVMQVGAAVMVLVATGLLLRSFERVLQRDPGFQPERLMTARIELPAAKYPANENRNHFADEVLRRLAAMPGVEEAAAASSLPVQGWQNFIVRLEENPNVRVSDAPTTGYACVTPGYFATMGMRVLVGRDFTPGDRENHSRVCVVNESFVRRYFPGRDPLGRRVETGFSDPPKWMEIVGVVNDTRNEGLEVEPREQVYAPFQQQPQFLAEGPALSLAVRTQPGAAGMAELIRQAVWAVDPDQPLYLLQPMTQVLGRETAQRRFTVTVLGAFAAVTLILAAVGLYGTMSGSVASRTRELGIRMALGAPRRAMVGGVLRQGMALAAMGTGIGLAGSLALNRLIASQLFEISTTDPLTMGGVALMLFTVTLVACYVPARRATRIDPMTALRCE